MGLFTDEKQDLLKSCSLTKLKQMAREKNVLVKSGSLWVERKYYEMALYDSPKVSIRYIKQVIESKQPQGPKVAVIEQKIPPTNCKKINVKEILGKYYYKEWLEAELEENNLPIKGSKEELIERLLDNIALDPQKLLEQIPNDRLKDICRDNDLYLTGNKEDLINRILSIIEEYVHVKKSPPPPTPIYYPPPPTHNIPQPKQNYVAPPRPPTLHNQTHQDVEKLFSNVVSDIFNWSPTTRHGTEGEYKIELQYYLKGLGYEIHVESGESRTDILVRGCVPIELKKEPSQSGYDRLIGQMVRHYRAYRCAIAVVCDVKRLQQYEDTEDNLKSIYVDPLVTIIKK
jgi:hypothetical protein